MTNDVQKSIRKSWNSGKKMKDLIENYVHPMQGKKHSKEAKEKQSKAKLGKPSPHRGKKWPQNSREKNSSWKGGRLLRPNGYVIILNPEHPNADSGGYIREHRLVMEEKIGRVLTKKEIVHHINGEREDNRPENLELFSNQSEHMTHYFEEKKLYEQYEQLMLLEVL